MLSWHIEILRADNNHFNGTIPTDFAPDDEPLGPKGWRFLRKCSKTRIYVPLLIHNSLCVLNYFV